MESIDLIKLKELKQERTSFFIYFSAPNCGVCENLLPKIKQLMSDEFPRLKAYQSDTAINLELVSQLGFYTNPSVVIYLKGQEIYRKSRIINLDELQKKVLRYYQMIYK